MNDLAERLKKQIFKFYVGEAGKKIDGDLNFNRIFVKRQ